MEILKEKLSTDERKRKISASHSAETHKTILRKKLSAEAVSNLLNDKILNELEKKTILDGFNSEHRKRLVQNLSSGSYIKIYQEAYSKRDTAVGRILEKDEELKYLRDIVYSPLLSELQKVDIITQVKRVFQKNSQLENGFDKYMSSILFTEEEKDNLLFNIDEVRKGTFDFGTEIKVDMDYFKSILDKKCEE